MHKNTRKKINYNQNGQIPTKKSKIWITSPHGTNIFEGDMVDASIGVLGEKKSILEKRNMKTVLDIKI